MGDSCLLRCAGEMPSPLAEQRLQSLGTGIGDGGEVGILPVEQALFPLWNEGKVRPRSQIFQEIGHHFCEAIIEYMQAD